MADVSVYDIKDSRGITDLGRTVLPADVLPFDFSRLDRAVEAENDIANKGLETIMANVKDMGKIQDELTGITSPGAYHAAELEAAKKRIGVDKQAFSSAVSNLENPMALYDIDRKTKRLFSDPVVKNIMHDNALLDYYKDHLKDITDPNLKLQAIKAMDDATKNATDKNAIKNLSIDQFKTVDLESAYQEALDKFAPYIPTTTQKVGPNGESYTEVVNQRDPAMVAKTREYFKKEAIVQNNLRAKGYVDANGKDTPWFDAIEKPALAPITQIANVRGATGGVKGGGKYQYQLSPNLTGANYKPNVYTDKEIGDVDLGVISSVETGGRSPDSVVHADPVTGINIGAYSFNGGSGGPAKDYLNTLTSDVLFNPEASAALEELKGMDLSNIDNLPKAKAAYAKIEKAIGADKLAGLENQYAVKTFAKPIVTYLKGKEGFEDLKLTPGETTLLTDTAIQWIPQTWKKWLDDYAKSDGTVSLTDFITKKRIEQATGNANKGNYNKPHDPDGTKLAQSINDRAVQVWQAAYNMDHTGPNAVANQSGANAPAPADISQFNQYVDPSVVAAQDSIVSEQNVAVMNKYGYGPKPQQ